MDLRTAALAALLATAACGDGAPETGGPVTPPPPLPPLTFGGDISALARIEQGGATFRYGNVAVDGIIAMRAGGMDLFRLRIFVAPNGTEVQVNDLAYTIALAKRVQSSGATLMLDFHYSDTWADPAHQETPAAWAGLGIDSLEARVEAYTAHVIDTLRDEGAWPRIVQIGNEIDAGLLWPVGRIGGTGDSDSSSYANFGRLLKAGVRGVRSVSGIGDSIEVMLHVSSGGDIARTQWVLDHAVSQGVAFDLIGLSYYPWWHGTTTQLRANLAATATRYARDVMIVETSYPWRDDWVPSGALPNPWSWPRTADGQRTFVRDLIAAVDATPNGRGRGIVWWYPEAVQVGGLFVWGGGSLALFDASGNVLPAMDLFRTTNLGRE